MWDLEILEIKSLYYSSVVASPCPQLTLSFKKPRHPTQGVHSKLTSFFIAHQPLHAVRKAEHSGPDQGKRYQSVFIEHLLHA